MIDFPYMVLLLTCIVSALMIFAPEPKDDEDIPNS